MSVGVKLFLVSQVEVLQGGFEAPISSLASDAKSWVVGCFCLQSQAGKECWGVRTFLVLVALFFFRCCRQSAFVYPFA
jgi:hypothetical protein